jgi:hypothetical protein
MKKKYRAIRKSKRAVIPDSQRRWNFKNVGMKNYT